MITALFQYCTKVYYDLTDAAGVVYHANYITLMARARTEALASCGFIVANLAESGVIFVVRSADIQYERPARLGVSLKITSTVEWASKARMYWNQVVQIESDICESCCQGRIEIVCVDQAFKPIACPEAIRRALNPNRL